MISTKSRRILATVLALGVLVVSTLSGCAKTTAATTAAGGTAETPSAAAQTTKTGEKVTIRFAHNWAGSDNKAPAFAEILNKFRAENPNIELIEETATGDELRTKVKVDLASNNLADVVMYWGGSILKPLVDNGVVLDVSKYLAVSKTLKKEDISNAAWQFYTFNNVTFGIPIEGFMSSFIVNKDLFKKYNLEYPKTEADLLAVAKVFKQNGIVPLSVGSKGGNPSHFYYSELYNQFANGTEEINSIGTTNKFNTENALKVAKIIDEQRIGGVFPGDTVANGDWSPSFELYNSGKAAMVYTYPWMLGGMKKEIVDVSQIIPLPKMDGAAKDPATVIQSSAVFGVVINKASFEDTAKQAAVAALVDAIVSADSFKSLAKVGCIPTRTVDIDLTAVAPMIKQSIEYSAKLEKVPSHFNTVLNDNAFTVFQNTLDELFAGAIAPDAFVAKVQAAFDEKQ